MVRIPLLLLFLHALPLLAQRSEWERVPVDWMPTGPIHAGIVYGFAEAPGDTLYAAAANGVYRSTDHGDRWTDISRCGDQWWESMHGLPGVDVYDIAVVPGGNVLAVTRGSRLYGFYPAARSWSGGYSDYQARYSPRSIAVDPSTGRVVLCNLVSLRTTVKGRGRWIQEHALEVDERNDMPTCRDLLVHDGVFYGAGVDRIYRRDGDSNWATVAVDGASAESPVTAFAVGRSGAFLVGIKGHGVVRSDDGGAGWIASSDGIREANVGSILVDSAGTLYGVASRNYQIVRMNYSRADAIVSDSAYADALYRSDDDGRHWSLLSDDLPFSNVVRLFCGSGGRLYAATWQGAFRSTDRGASWRRIMDGITAAHVDTIVSAGGRIVYTLANQRLFVTRDGGGEWRDLTDSLDGFVPRLLATIGDGAVYVHARRRGSAADDRLFRVSESEGARIAVDGPPVSSIRCMAARPDGTLFFCTDEPEVLHRLNPDMGMTRSDISIRSVIRQLTVMPDGGLYASTGRGLFFTTDDGTSWTAAMEGRAFTTLALTSRGMPILLSRVPMRPIDGKWELLPPQASIDARSIAIDPSDVIYIEGGYHPMCSRDFGETWSTIYYGLRPWATTVVAADEDGDVFLGTPANGIYRRN